MVRIREKACDRCSQLSAIAYRVKWERSGRWVFVCPVCWPRLSQNNPDYVYGGTWKAKKR